MIVSSILRNKRDIMTIGMAMNNDVKNAIDWMPNREIKEMMGFNRESICYSENLSKGF